MSDRTAAPEPPLHETLAPVAGLVGTFVGEGHGDYPTVDAFRYLERVTFGHVGKPFLAYQQATRHPATGAPMHAETGYLRTAPVRAGEPWRAELVLAHPTGIVEVDEGELVVDGSGIVTLDLRSSTIGITATAKDVRELRRRLVLDGDQLSYDLWMAHADTALTHHLAAVLQRDA